MLSQFMYKYAGKENLFVHQTEVSQVSGDMKTVWFSNRLHTCTYGRWRCSQKSD